MDTTEILNFLSGEATPTSAAPIEQSPAAPAPGADASGSAANPPAPVATDTPAPTVTAPGADASGSAAAAAANPPAPVVEPVNPFAQLSNIGASAEEILTKFNDLQSKVVNSDLALRIDNILKAGGSVGDVENFVKIQTIDPDKVSPVDLVKMHVAAQNPFLTEAEVLAKMAVEMGLERAISTNGVDLDATESYKLKTAREQAASWLAQQKISDIGSRYQATQDANAKAIAEAAQRIVATVPDTLKIGGDLGFEMPVAPSLKEQIANFAAREGVKPSDLPAFAAKVAFLTDFDGAVNSLAQHVRANALKDAVIATAGKPIETPAPPPPAPPSQANPLQSVYDFYGGQ